MKDVIINFPLPNLKKKKKEITHATLLKMRGMPKVSTLKVKPAICIIWTPKYVIVAYSTKKIINGEIITNDHVDQHQKIHIFDKGALCQSHSC